MTLKELRTLVDTADNALYTLYDNKGVLMFIDVHYESLLNCTYVSNCAIKRACPLELRESDHAVVDWLIVLV